MLPEGKGCLFDTDPYLLQKFTKHTLKTEERCLCLVNEQNNKPYLYAIDEKDNF